MVAKEAGVSVETVYSSVGAKAELLKVAVDVAIVGDDDPVPLEERPEFLALGEGAQEQRCRALALLVEGIHRRAGALRRVVSEAAGADQGLRELDAELYAQEHASWTTAIRRIRGSEPSRRLVDQVNAVLGPDVHHVLTGPRGWSADDYISWAADMAALLLRENS
jgi:AcrR family transcriptional regulator